MADAGFFGTSWEDPRTQATLAAAAGLLGGGTFTESLTRGLLGYQGGINKARDDETKRRLLEAQMQSLLAEAEQRRAEAAKYQATMAERARIQQVIAANMGGPITGGQAASAGGGPTPAAAGAVGKVLPPNFTQMILGGVPPEIVKAIAESPNLGRPEVGGQIETVQNGAPVTVMRDKYGNPIGSALPKWTPPSFQNVGNRVIAIDPASLKVGGSWNVGMSPEAAATREVAQATRDAATIQTQMSNATNLRKEFEGLPEVKSYKLAFPSYKSIVDAAGRDTKQADINIVYGIAKLYDPTSVVREGEYSTIANSQTIPEAIKGLARSLQGQGRLTPATRQQLVTEANSRIATYGAEVAKAKGTYSAIAQRNGINPADVFQSMGDFSTGGTVKWGDLPPGN